MKKVLPVLTLLLLAGGLLAGIVLVRQNQDVRSRAVSPGGAGKLIVSPVSAVWTAGQVVPIQIKINTGSLAMSGLTFQLADPYSGTAPALDIVDASGQPVGSLTLNSSLPGYGTDWAFPINSVTRSNGMVTINFAALNTSITGFTAVADTVMASFYVKVNQTLSSPLILTFDPTQTQMITKTDPHDFLDTPINPSYTLNAPETTLSFGFKMQGITSSGISKTVTLTVRNDSVTKTYPVTATSGAGGVFSASNFTLAGLAAGNYDILIKDDSHLQKKLGSMPIMAGANAAPSAWRDTTIPAGDFTGDNHLKIDDIGQMLTSYTALSVPATGSLAVYDVNGDGNITTIDVSIVLSNYTALDVPGD